MVRQYSHSIQAKEKSSPKFQSIIDQIHYSPGWKRFLKKISPENPSLNKVHTLRLNDQNALLQSNRDLKILKRAISSFPALQQIKLLRLQDAADEDILEQLHENPTDEDAYLDWAPACSRAIRNLGIALLGSGCPSVRFFGPQISPEAAVTLLHTPSYAISAIATRLTCLDVNFHSVRDISVIMSDLSHVFREFFEAARGLIKINVGFPPKNPVDFKLESIFHHLTWERLKSLGIQGWQLDSSEIIEILRRHQKSLQEFRCPCVYLHDGSRWKDVLLVLGSNMDELAQVALQDIDYADHFKTEIQNGVEMPPSPPRNPTVIEEGEELTGDAISGSTGPSHQYRYYDGVGNNLDSRYGAFVSPAELKLLTVEDLGDNGVQVERDQWQLWEAWIISRIGQRSYRPSA